MAGGPARATIDDLRALCRPTEHIGAGVDRMSQHHQHRVVCRRSPLDLAHAAVVAAGDGQLKSLILGPEQDLPGASELLELVEQETDDATDALVGVHLYLPNLVPAVARRQDELQLAPQRLRVACRKPTLAQEAQLILRHRPLQSQEKA